MCLGCRPGPQLGLYERQLTDESLTHQSMFLSLSSSHFSLPLKINLKNLFKKERNSLCPEKTSSLAMILLAFSLQGFGRPVSLLTCARRQLREISLCYFCVHCLCFRCNISRFFICRVGFLSLLSKAHALKKQQTALVLCSIKFNNWDKIAQNWKRRSDRQ